MLEINGLDIRKYLDIHTLSKYMLLSLKKKKRIKIYMPSYLRHPIYANILYI